MNFKYIFLIFTLLPVILYSQNVEKQKYEYAKSFEQSGDFETSGRIYKELFDINPKNTEFFQGVVRTYKGLSKFTELLVVVREYVKYSNTVESYSIFAEMLWRIGSADSANIFWEKAIELSSENPKTYLMVFDSQIEVKQYAKAISTLIKARDNLKKPRIFADELCQMYVIIADYKKGTFEALNILYETTNIALAQGRISALMASPDARIHIESVLEQESNSESDNFLILKVYSWYLRAVGKFDKAFELYKEMDILTKSQGREVLGFANDSKNDGQYEIALKAYEYIISLGKDGKFLSSALYGYPRTLELKILTGKSINNTDAESIIKRYREITIQFPDNIASADASYRIAVINLDYLGNNEESKTELNKIINRFPNTQNAAMALNLLGSIYLIENNLDKAYESYNLVYKNYKRFAPDEVISAQYNLAELEYFKGNVDSSQVLYTELIRNFGSDATNNALNRINLIETNKNFVKAIITFAQAELKLKQQNNSEAIKMFKSVVDDNSSEDLTQRSLIHLSDIYFHLSVYDTAIVYGTKLIKDFSKSNYRDRAMILCSECYINLNQKDNALRILNELIVEYPRSIFAQEARDKIRNLREDKNF